MNITWLANANMNGPMTWADATTWAANLSFTDGVHTYDNWRLPTVSPVNGTIFNTNGSYNGSTDVGHNVNTVTSEMSHLFYAELGNKAYLDTAGVPQAGWGLTNTGSFTNLQADYYWFTTEFAPSPESAWFFLFNVGYQDAATKTSAMYALAVSPGDVAAVPEAETYALMLTGLGLIGWRARRRG
ncbi:MAG TPA: DUF1566 domain-containing protein [Thiobacillus sp.]